MGVKNAGDRVVGLGAFGARFAMPLLGRCFVPRGAPRAPQEEPQARGQRLQGRERVKVGARDGGRKQHGPGDQLAFNVIAKLL